MPVLQVSCLPDFVFLRPEAEEVLRLSDSGARIASLADQIGDVFPRGAKLGLIFRTSPELVLTWLGAVSAGMRPIILTYPTAKLTRAYWSAELANSITSLGLDGLLTAPEIEIDRPGTTILCPDATEDAAWAVEAIEDTEIFQQSSGTTGLRKGIGFPLSVMAEHVRLYDRTMRLGPGDCIVSWLPLYHDMGFVACFLAALVTGTRLVLIDPIDWIGAPPLLYDAIERHRGTVCYMPNFAFRVMTRHAVTRDLSSMRLWIACAEPVVPETIEAFLTHIQAPPDRFAACYAMAENVFAVTQSEGFRTAEIAGRRLTSCGAPIAGVEVRIIEGEIQVRSPTALTAYADGTVIRDPTGFYPTGDLGELIDGELYVQGRKHDVLIQAGVKYLLSELDAALSRVVPDLAGRGAALPWQDEEAGTQAPLFLIERRDFFTEPPGPELREALAEATGLTRFSVAYVPLGFLTKTSSGKINRTRSLGDWRAVLAQRADEAGPLSLADDIAAELGPLRADRPIGEQIDSLGLAILSALLDERGIGFDPAETPAELFARDHGRAAPAIHDADAISIVSIAETNQLHWLNPDFCAFLAETLECKVRFEHVCLPPVPIILSDLIFHDYVLPRAAGPHASGDDFAAVRAQLGKLKQASVIVMSDVVELFWGRALAFPALAHDLARDPETDLLACRQQRYAAYNDRLPLKLVAGPAIPLASIPSAIQALGRYLDVPIFRFALMSHWRELTADWEFTDYVMADNPLVTSQPDEARITACFLQFLLKRLPGLKRLPSAGADSFNIRDLPHFCSVWADRDAIEDLLVRYDRFLVVGPQASLPYLRRRAGELGKAIDWRPTFPPAGEIDAGGWQCVIGAGIWGKVETTKPVIGFMAMGSMEDGRGLRALNAPADFVARFDPYERMPDVTGGYYVL